MLKKLLFGLVGLCASAAIAWGAVTLSDGTVTTPVTIYGATGGVSGAAGVGTENSSTQSNVGILKTQAMIYNGSAGNLVSLSSASASLDVNALANGIPAGQYRWNGSSWDRVRGTFETASASLITLATTSANGTDQTNWNGHGVKCVYDVTAITGTNTVLTIQGKDTASGKYYTLLASAAIVGTGTTVLTVYPGQLAAANSVANDNVPRIWRVITTNTALTVFTGTVGCTTLL